MTVTCGLKVGGPCPNQAVEVLIARAPHGDHWEAYWRCEQHPAADAIRLLAHMEPDAETVVLTIPFPGYLSARKAATA